MTKPVPESHHAITPHLVFEGAAKAIDFYKAAFGAEEIARLAAPDGRLMHAEIKIGDSILMLADDFPEMGEGRSRNPKALGGTPVTLHLYTEDVDALMKQAEAAGAKVTRPATDRFWGDRYGKLEDPFGHDWGVATRIKDLTLEEMRAAAATMFGD